MDYTTFEESELEMFVGRYCSDEDISLILTDAPQEQMPQIREETKIGLKEGMDAYSRGQKFFDSDLRAYFMDKRTAKKVAERLDRIVDDRKGVKMFAEDVAGRFKVFAYNPALERYKATFKSR